MALKHIRLYSRLVVQSSFLAKWLGERVRAREWTFFLAVFYKMRFLNVGSYMTLCRRCLVSLGVLLQMARHTSWELMQLAWLSSPWCWLLLLIAMYYWLLPHLRVIPSIIIRWAHANVYESTRKPWSCTKFLKSCIFYSKSSKNPYQYCKLSEKLYQVLQVTCAVSECAMISKLRRIKSLPPPICCHGIVTLAAHL